METVEGVVRVEHWGRWNLYSAGMREVVGSVASVQAHTQASGLKKLEISLTNLWPSSDLSEVPFLGPSHSCQVLLMPVGHLMLHLSPPDSPFHFFLVWPLSPVPVQPLCCLSFPLQQKRTVPTTRQLGDCVWVSGKAQGTRYLG